jgi:cyclopropane-fatty-acyl-phospholipid synthase
MDPEHLIERTTLRPWTFRWPSKATPVQGALETLLYRALLPMQRGSMRIELPDGRVWAFGGEEASGSEDTVAPAAKIRIHNPIFFRKCVLFGDIGFGESYVDGDWETDSIANVVSWFILNLEDSPTLSGTRRKSRHINWLGALNQWIYRLSHNSLTGSKRNISAHYDLSNDLFRTFLDSTLTYSCAYFESPAQSLEAAQLAKYDRLCRKLRLRPQDHVLEIGCGWGGFSLYAARYYGCRITAITISQQQFEHAQSQIHQAGLERQIDLRLQDYREVEGQFDKIVSIEMLEAVGYRYLNVFFAKCHQLLKRQGLLGLQVITCADHRFEVLRRNVDWSQKHIFPGSLILSIAAINASINQTGDLFLHNLEDLGHCYAQTLSAWHQRFNENLAAVKALGFDEPFIRKWNYYLMYCQAAFAMRHNSVVQAIYTRQNNYSLEAR